MEVCFLRNNGALKSLMVGRVIKMADCLHRKVENELQGLRNDVRRLAADRDAHEEKSHAAETQLAENRQVINILLDRLYQLLMANQVTLFWCAIDSNFN